MGRAPAGNEADWRSCPRLSVSGSAIRRNISSAEFGDGFDAHRRHRARRRTRRAAERAIGRPLAKPSSSTAFSRRRKSAAPSARRTVRWFRFRGRNGDPVLAAFGDALARRAATCAQSSICRPSGSTATMPAPGSTNTPPRPGSARGRERLAAEQAWQNLGARTGAAVAILRLAGIYGPGQQCARADRARRRAAHRQARTGLQPHPCRRHCASDRRGVRAKGRGIFNVADDEPSAPGDPIVFAAQLLGREPPPEIPFEEAAPSMSPLALSFWQDCRRVRNDKLKRELGVTLRYPTYREGLRAAGRNVEASARRGSDRATSVSAGSAL